MRPPASPIVQRAATCLLLLAWLAATAAASAGWPTYRGDAARSGYTADALPARLTVRWVRKPRHAPQPAWSGRDTRMPFDEATHVVVAGDLAFFGSSADDKVVALDAATGSQRWAFFTGGPVRFAPALWRDRLFAVSDDGFLYCLRADDGKVLWKLRGGPTPSMVLGNGRMISRWPARGGPAVAGGTVYFAAGIWPSEGIWIYAVDAESGKVVWCNETAGGITMPQPHGGANARSGVAAQGYLAVAGDRLLVPTGRAVPAVFDRATGRFLYFHLQRFGHYGGAEVVAGEGQFFNGGCVFDLASGQLVHRGIPTPAMAVAPGHVLTCLRGKAPAPDEVVALARSNGLLTPASAKAPAWRAANPCRPVHALIAAGESIVIGGDGRVAVLDGKSGEATATVQVDGAALGLAAAGGRLFVSTDTGTIACFDGSGTPEPRVIAPAIKEPSPPPSPAFAAAADEIVRRTGVRRGYCVDLACGEGDLALELARRTDLHVCAIDPDPARVHAARRRLDAAGLYGIRVSVHQGDPAHAPFPGRIANLVVSGASVAAGAGSVQPAEVRRIQRPYGGVAALGKPGAMTVAVRPALYGAGKWTHQYCDPANTNCSLDRLVHGPLGVVWFGDLNFQMPSRHGRGPAPLFDRGRLFIEGLNALRCIDPYNGTTLWEYPLPEVLKPFDQEHLMGTAGTGSNLCLGADALFVHTGQRCLKLDPATGKLLAEFPTPARPDGTPGTWGYIACEGGTLFGTVADTAHIVKWRYGRSDMGGQFTESVLLFALDAATGSTRWTYRPEHSIRHNAIAIGGGCVFLIDRLVALRDLVDQEAAKRRGRPVADHPPGTLMALDAADGTVKWKAPNAVQGTMLAFSEAHDVLVVAYQDTRFKLDSEVGGRLAAFRGSDGTRLWDVAAAYASRPLLNGRLIVAQPGAWDIVTGKRQDFAFSRSYGCGTVAGSTNLLLFRSATLGYLDLAKPAGTENYGGIRPGCWINTLPVGGLVLMPDATDRCTCSYLNKASMALEPYGLRMPVISPAGGVSRKRITVRITPQSDDAQIRYTVDGSVPNPSSRRYVKPFTVRSGSTLVRARAFSDGLPPSPVAEAAFTVDPSIIPIGGPEWTVHDSPGGQPAASRWEVANGVATELSNHCLGQAANADPLVERPGSLRVYRPGAAYADGEMSLELASPDDDGIGLAFRLRDPQHHYLWAMDRQRGFHILACKDGETYRVLARNARRYARGKWHQVRVVLDGPKITVYLDGEKDLEAVDETFARGTFALYAWGCAGAKFRSVRWAPLRRSRRP